MAIKTVYKPEGELIETLENKQYLQSFENLQRAFESQKILESRATLCDSQHNLTVNLGGYIGVIPREECAIGIDDGTTKDIAIISKVNKPVCFVIKDIILTENAPPQFILSRRAVQEKCMKDYVNTLSLGDVIECKVTHLEQFGAFVDIGCGIPSLIPIDMISVSRISHPCDRFKVGDNILAVVNKRELGRIGLTHKELLGTWEENANLFSAGETVAGIVRSIEDYGVFVELTPNLAGLAELHSDVYEGQQASVYIKSLIPEKMKVKLIIVDSFDASYERQKPNYFFTGEHIDSFNYSPDCSIKKIKTVF
jgi:small subunit ribosomal protein S1